MHTCTSGQVQSLSATAAAPAAAPAAIHTASTAGQVDDTPERGTEMTAAAAASVLSRLGEPHDSDGFELLEDALHDATEPDGDT